MRRIAALVLLTLLLLSCDEGHPSLESAYAEGYRKGASDVVKEIERRAKTSRDSLRRAVGPKLLWGTIIASLLTLFGDKLAEAIRQRVSEVFRLEPTQQSKLAAFGFWTCAVAAITILYGRYGVAPIPPVLILLGTSAWHLHTGYIPALLAGDKPKRSIALGKMKTLLFLVLVIGMVFEILSTGSPIAFR